MTPTASKPTSTSSCSPACYHCRSSNHIASAAVLNWVLNVTYVVRMAISPRCAGSWTRPPSLTEETLQSGSSDDSGDFTVFATASTSATRRKVLINDMCIDILIDTGAEVSILPCHLVFLSISSCVLRQFKPEGSLTFLFVDSHMHCELQR